MRAKAVISGLCAAWLATVVPRGAGAEELSAQAQGKKVSLDISAQPIGDALNEFAHQAGLQVVFYTEISKGLSAPRVSGSYTAQEALERLLANTGLHWQFINDETVAIREMKAGMPELSGSAAADSIVHSSGLRLAQSDRGSDSGQETDQPSDQQDPLQTARVEEIIVTAQKREQRAFDVPMSIAVIGGQDIERRGLIGMEDYLRSIPGVNQIDQGPTSNAVVIRGITTSPQFENFSSGTSVGMYFDETNITAAAGLGGGGIDIRPVDLARIEVLRGPQGTTFGSASLGGAVRLIPQRPVLNRFESAVSGSLSGTSREGGANSMIQGMLNLPIASDWLALRAVAYRFDDSGAYENIVGIDPASLTVANNFGVGNLVNGYTQDDVGRTVSTGARLSTAWAVNERTDATLVYLTQKIEQDGWPLSTLDGFRQARFPIASQARLRGERGELADSDIDLINATVNVDLGSVVLTSVLSWTDSGSQTASTAQSATNPRSSTNGSEFRNSTGEVRLRSTYDGPLQFLAGVFYEDIKEDFLQTSDWPGPAGTNPFTTDPILFFEQTRDLTQLAAFGEISYALTDRFTVTGGARWFEYDKHETELREGALAASGGVPLGTGMRSSFDSKDDNTSWKANLSYKVSQDSLLYATWSQGFRLGRATAGLPSTCDANGDGIVDGSNVSLASTRIVDSDFLDNYEIGAKLAFADRKLFIDGAIYRINWDGLPIRERGPVCGLTYTANVGSAVSEGIELQARLLPVRGLQIDIGGSYNRAELSRAAPSLNAPKGAPLPGAPDINANLGIQYDFPILGFDTFVRSDAFYTGDFHGDLLQTSNTLAGGYVKLDVRAGVKIKDLRVEVFVKNVTNEDEFTWRGLTNANSFFGYRLRPRTIGVELGYSFQ